VTATGATAGAAVAASDTEAAVAAVTPRREASRGGSAGMAAHAAVAALSFSNTPQQFLPQDERWRRLLRRPRQRPPVSPEQPAPAPALVGGPPTRR
jgi:hypothetical protein